MKPYGSLRTHGAGTLRRDHDGQEVALAGWAARRRDHGGVAFIDLRDRSGVVQVVADPTASAALEAAHRVRSEYVIRVIGTVRTRPAGMVNPALDTGEVEVAATELEVLAESETPPFPLEDRVDRETGVAPGAEGGRDQVDENLRLRYRYLDLRRPAVARAIRLRSEITRVIRRVMESHGFLDVETPILTRSTPEGARDFLVPARLQPGKVYALPQSPQLFKQLLMVAGLERYYQIARCFRDEDLRADRQPEFTQLDVEASFIDEEDLFILIEELMAALWSELLDVQLDTPFPSMTFAQAMARYGTDAPDTRFDLELVDLGEVFAGTEVGIFKGALEAGGSVLAVRLPDGGELTRREFDEWVEFARGRGAKGLAWAVVEDDGSLRSPLAKFMSDDEVADLRATTKADPGDAIFFGAGETRFTQELLGALRVALARARGLVPEDRWDFVWVTRWPLLEWDADRQRWDAMHHPFTAPDEASLDRLEEAPGEAMSRAYDLALNGAELGGGSIRIHRRDVQQRVFALLGIGEEEADEKFGFLLDALSYGAPPHGGIAFGLDRIAMLMAGAASLRDVIAFPKTQSGADPMTAAPSDANPGALAEVGLRLLPPPAR
ncbi:MAG TPA: aspartate--tRNA ligase [Egibacteraceae bacterium]|nr:aspartate--tRNA ligase [Egibacteraceae bacterium]